MQVNAQKSELRQGEAQQKLQGNIARDVINRSLDQGGDYLLRREFEQAPEQLAEQ